MHLELEEIFRLREECDLEIDAEVRAELYRKFHGKLDELLKRHGLTMTHGSFLAATKDDYKNWRRNPH